MAWSPTQSGVFHPQVVLTTGVQAGVLSGFSGTGIFIPYSATDSYKSAVSGDIRELLYSLLDATYEKVQESSEPPSNFTISRSYASDDETSAQKVFSVKFKLNTSNTTYDVKDE